ncbi:MAG: C4-dicarboxylate transporter DcuC [Phascolarctobacterium sp.]|nr:C4-dicarboxylate transporter DcuC [Phascolarctobacterium sp.]
MMLYIGIILVIATLYLLIKRYEARMILVISGLVMCCVAGAPIKALDAFAKGMGNGMISSACSSMGFALIMHFTGCDKHLINALAKVLTKVRFLVIPGAVLGTFIVNIALPSAAGTAAAAGAVFIPIMMGMGVHPALAAAAVKCGTYGSMLNPGLAHNVMVAKIAKVDVSQVIGFHYVANFASAIIAAIAITAIAYYMHEDKDNYVEGVEIDDNFKINPLYALMPLVPIIILLLGATKTVPMLKMGVAQAMVIGAILTFAVTRTNPAELSKNFFEGMGKAYTDIIGIIIAAGVFVAGMNALGLVKAFINAMVSNPAIAKVCAACGPFVLAVITGSGDAATFAFNEAITPAAAQFGMTPVQLGSVATLAGTLGRTMSPLAGATMIVAGIAGVNPMEVAKRNVIPMVLALAVGCLFLF